MALFIATSGYEDADCTIAPGALLDDARFPVAAWVAAGLVVVPRSIGAAAAVAACVQSGEIGAIEACLQALPAMRDAPGAAALTAGQIAALTPGTTAYVRVGNRDIPVVVG
jgi:hypothetical protein